MKAVIFDIDGTLAKMNGRSPYDYSKVSTDVENEPICKLFKMYMFSNKYHMIIFTGRDASCREDTLKWLEDNNLVWDHFDMRPEGNKECDTIVKKKMYDRIKDDYDVEIVFDDRNRCVDLWRSLGLTCCQVDVGNF